MGDEKLEPDQRTHETFESDDIPKCAAPRSDGRQSDPNKSISADRLTLLRVR